MAPPCGRTSCRSSLPGAHPLARAPRERPVRCSRAGEGWPTPPTTRTPLTDVRRALLSVALRLLPPPRARGRLASLVRTPVSGAGVVRVSVSSVAVDCRLALGARRSLGLREPLTWRIDPSL